MAFSIRCLVPAAVSCLCRTYPHQHIAILHRVAVLDIHGARRDVRKSDIVLVTYEGTFVRWGRSPLLLNSPGELTPDEKILKMVLFEKKLGPLSSYKFVDIRFDDIQHGPCVRQLSDADFIQ